MLRRLVCGISTALSLALFCVSAGQAVNSDMMIAAYVAKGQNLALKDVGRGARHANSAARSKEVHTMLWQRFNAMFPSQYRSLVKEFEIATDGPGNITAYSGLSNKHYGAWVLGIDPADVFPNGQWNKSELDASLIHEFGHILFQREGQMRYSKQAFASLGTGRYHSAVNRARESCQTFFTFDACAEPTSYLYHYMYGFWQPMLNQWVANAGSPYGKQAFMKRHNQGFVSSYAASHPVEDMVESFTAFVLRQRPTGNTSLADRKVNFFYQFQEMVNLRAHIRASL